LLKAKALTFKAKDLTLKANAKDSKFVLEDMPRPRTKAKEHCQEPRSFSINSKGVTLNEGAK